MRTMGCLYVPACHEDSALSSRSAGSTGWRELPIAESIQQPLVDLLSHVEGTDGPAEGCHVWDPMLRLGLKLLEAICMQNTEYRSVLSTWGEHAVAHCDADEYRLMGRLAMDQHRQALLRWPPPYVRPAPSPPPRLRSR
jgi:hypothetical protein